MLDKEFFEYAPDGGGRDRPALREAVPQRLMRLQGLLTEEADDNEESLRVTRIPVHCMREVRERCVYTAEFGTVEEGDRFPPPVQLVTIPCRSPTGDGRCARTGDDDRPCTLFGVVSSVETPGKERLHFIVAPVSPGTSLTPSGRELLLRKRERLRRSLRHWEQAFTPVTMLMDATTRGVQFWLHYWFGK